MQLIRPSAHAEDRSRRPQRHDLAGMEAEQVASGAMEYPKLESMLRDIQNEPRWRRDADLNAAYYDGYQTTPEQERLRAEGQPVATVNLISRTVNTLLGNEARARTSWKLSADAEEDFGDVSDALQMKLTQAQRETNADIAVSEAYASQAKAGLGWVEVSRVANPFEPYAYRVKPVHRNEIWWDWRAKEMDLSDARWLIRQQWHDLDDLEQLMPQFADLFRYYGGASWSNFTFAAAIHATETTRSIDDTRQQFRINPDEWFDNTRKRIKTYEVWYRVYKQTVAILLPDGTVKEFNPANAMHQAAVERGIAKLLRAPKRVLRMALFVGPHRLMDVETQRERFPYIPFWAFRDDVDRSPYSMVQGMRYPQDEYNARRSRLMWLLQCAQVFVDDDALSKMNNFHDLARDIMRPDAIIILNKDRKHDSGIRIERNTQLPAEQSSAMNDARNLIMEQPGVSAGMMGDKVPGVTSGVAYNSLVTQSNIAVGDHDDNYRMGRRMVGEALVDLIIEDCKRPNMPVKVGVGETQRVVILNQWDAKQQRVLNSVEGANVQVALDDVPNTPAYKMQQQQQIAMVLQVAGNDEAARAVLIPAFLEASDLVNRREDARWLRKRYGIPTPGDRQAQTAADQASQAQQQKAGQMQEAAAQLDLADKQAEVDVRNSTADLNRARVAEMVHRLQQPAQPDPAAQEDQAIHDSLAEAAG